ncbi:hemerythrin domain-containing protein [Brevibacterium epidermidis]|uniref:hemerythrin domain-containing protein n=1 Tax=Brevibacterium epidermidis TaxID=1698 RepID=UPI000BFAA0DD|nr:hemerythrin domain-containing protein [Brevibacterium epidermidis]
MSEMPVKRSLDATRPADTLTMTLFHAALRRDLERARFLLENPHWLSPRRARRLGRMLLWDMGELRRHHEGEDHYLWPLLLERSPESSELLNAMENEHLAIDEPLAELEVAARGLVAARNGPQQVLAALDVLEGPLRTHLEHEEADGMDIVTRVLNHQEWKEFEQRAWAAGYTPLEALRFLAWICDGVDWSPSVLRRTRMPVPFWRVLSGPLSSIAAVPGASVWAGTPAARIRSRVTPR